MTRIRDPKWMEIARGYLGLREAPGRDANPKIVEWLRLTSLPPGLQNSDETPWCAAAIEGILREAGVKGTGLANARSYLNWGVPADGNCGDIAVLWRLTRESASGHVAFVEGWANDGVVLLGGNQGNTLSYAKFPFDRILGYRRPAQAS